MTPTMTPYRSASQPGRDGFWQLLRAELTKLRSVRGWVITLLAITALTAVFPIFLAKTATSNDAMTCDHGQCVAEGENIATGPAGTAVVDSFYFVHQPLTVDGSITVRMTALHGSGARPQLPPGVAAVPATEPWAKGGLIIKANTTPGSAYAAVLATGSHGIRMQYNYTHDLAGPATTVSSASPQWLRLTRSGDLITGSESVNGRQWTTIGTARLTGLPATVQAGLFVASPNFVQPVGTGDSTIGGPTQATAAFDHLALRGGTAAQSWTGTEIGTGLGGPGNPARGPGGGPAGQVKCKVCGPAAPSHRFTDLAGRFTVTGSGDIAPFVPIVDPVHVVFLSTIFGLIAVIALGTLFISAEYRRGLIRTTVTASPRRGRILLAKALVVAAATFVAVGIGTAIALPIVEHQLYRNGWRPPVWPQLALTSGTGLQIVLGTAALAAVAAVLGLAAGVAFRRSASAVLAVVGALIVPLILAFVLPLSPASWLLRITPAAAFSLQQTTPKYSQVTAICAPYHACLPLAPWHGFAVLCLWAAVALGGAVYLLRSRDV